VEPETNPDIYEKEGYQEKGLGVKKDVIRGKAVYGFMVTVPQKKLVEIKVSYAIPASIKKSNLSFKYDLKNLPRDKSYELKVVYEVYNNKEKVREEILLGTAYGPTDDKIEDTNISINIQENKIRIMFGGHIVI